MYEDDTPPAERRAQALSLDRDLLRELLGQEELRELIDADALAEVEASLRPRSKSPDHLHDILRLRGDLRVGEFDEAHAAILEAERRAVRIRLAGDERLIAVEDAGRYRDALGVMPPSGLPDAFLEGGADSLRQLVRRYARGRGPFTTAQVSEWFGVDVEQHLRELEREDKLVRGELRPGGSEREWCDPDVLRRLRRASLAALRREVEPAEQAALGKFLPHWHGIDRRATLREALIPLQGLALPVSLWESEVLPRRVPGYRPEQLDQLCASGELVWVGAGLDRVAVFFREDAPVLGRPAAAPAPDAEAHDAIRSALAGGARFWGDLLEETGLGDADVLPALWDLVWAGEVTNDAWQPLRAERRYQPVRPERRARRFSRSRASRPTATQGRWALAEGLFAGQSGPSRARRAPARASGDRHARRRARRGHPGRLRRGVLGAARARDARYVPPRLLRRGARWCAVRARRRGRATARAAPARRGRARGARARGGGSGAAVRGGDSLAEAVRLACGSCRGRTGRPARRRGGALRRAGWADARPAARARGGVAPRRARGARGLRQAGRREAARGGALRRRAGDRAPSSCPCSSTPAFWPAPAARFFAPERPGRGGRA